MIDRLPGIFGKWSKPEYNTVVATFIHRVIEGKKLEIINSNHNLVLTHVDDVVKRIISFVNQEAIVKLKVESITVGELAALLKEYHGHRKNLHIPNFKSELEKNLWSTYLSFLNQGSIDITPTKFTDDRGWLSELIKGNLDGQIFLSSTKPGITRGNHWHNNKLEKFIVLKGIAKIFIQRYLL